jgi:hypothetical protein
MISVLMQATNVPQIGSGNHSLVRSISVEKSDLKNILRLNCKEFYRLQKGKTKMERIRKKENTIEIYRRKINKE